MTGSVVVIDVKVLKEEHVRMNPLSLSALLPSLQANRAAAILSNEKRLERLDTEPIFSNDVGFSLLRTPKRAGSVIIPSPPVVAGEATRRAASQKSLQGAALPAVWRTLPGHG